MSGPLFIFVMALGLSVILAVFLVFVIYRSIDKTTPPVGIGSRVALLSGREGEVVRVDVVYHVLEVGDITRLYQVTPAEIKRVVQS